MKKIFELHQRLALMVNEYRILEDGPKDELKLVAFARQKRLAIREKFTLYADENERQAIATSQARSIMEFGVIFDIKDASGKVLAGMKKEFKKSLISSTWSIYEPGMKNLLFTVSEKSKLVAVFRRLWGFIPIVGEIPFPVKYHFVIRSDDKLAGEYIKTTLWRDHYALYLEEEFEARLDMRAWMIAAVLLDAMQSR